MDNVYPWSKPPLNDWSICGMNHYHVDGQRQLFVSMVKNGRCITSEGNDDFMIWNNLVQKANKEN